MKRHGGVFNAIILFLVMFILASPIYFLVSLHSGRMNNTTARSIKTSWGVAIPENARDIYLLDNLGYYNKGLRYTVFESGETWDIVKSFSLQKNSALETEVRLMLEFLAIPEKEKVSPSVGFY